MAKKVGVLVIHGMGNPEANFAEGLVRRVRGRLGADEAEVAFASCYWSPILQIHQDRTWERLQRSRTMDAKAIRKWIISALGDPASYLAGFFKDDQPVYGDIHERVRASLALLEAQIDGAETPPLLVLAHSLGSVIMSNYLWDEQTGKGRGQTPFEQGETLTSFITYGSTIPLFLPPRRTITCIRFPSPNLHERYRHIARWLNLFDPDDVLGYPLRDIWTQTQGTVIHDMTVNVGAWPLSETPLAHTLYDQDDDFLDLVTEQLETLLAAAV